MVKTKAASDLKMTSAVQVRGGRPSNKNNQKYAAGWLYYPGEPDEDVVFLVGTAHSEIFFAVETRRVFKQIKSTKEWFRFAFTQPGDPRSRSD